MLQFFYALYYPLEPRLAAAYVDAHLRRLVQYITLARQIRDQDASGVPGQFGVDVLISHRIPHHRADVDPSLVGECAAPDEWQVAPVWQIGQFGNVVRHRRQHSQPVASDRLAASLELEHWNDRTEIGVAAAFPIPVDRTLHMRRSVLYRGDRVCYRQVGIVMGMDSNRRLDLQPHSFYDLRQPARQSPAVRVTQYDRVSAGLVSRLQRLQGKIWIGRKAVKEMLGIINDLAAGGLEMS